MDYLTLTGGGASGCSFIVPAPSRSPNNTDFLKVHNEVEKVTKFGLSRPLFQGEIAV